MVDNGIKTRIWAGLRAWLSPALVVAMIFAGSDGIGLSMIPWISVLAGAYALVILVDKRSSRPHSSYYYFGIASALLFAFLIQVMGINPKDIDAFLALIGWLGVSVLALAGVIHYERTAA